MNNSRRIGAVVAAAAAAMGMATVGLASPAAASERGPEPTSTWLRAVRAHTGTWVSIGWSSNRRICDAEVRLDGGRRVDVDYPGNRRFASFSRGDTLRPGDVDFTRFRVTPDFDRAGVAVLRASIRYDECGRRTHSQVKSIFLTLPVVRSNWHAGQQGHLGDKNFGGHDLRGNDMRGNDIHGNDMRGNDIRGNKDDRNMDDRNKGNDDKRGGKNTYSGDVSPATKPPVNIAPTTAAPATSKPTTGFPATTHSPKPNRPTPTPTNTHTGYQAG
jgi:hypothetical protein